MSISEVTNEDNMAMMARYPDKYFELAIVDPPYGIEDKISKGGNSRSKSSCTFHQMYSENSKSWDKVPNPEYFKELVRVSKNQIIWGANYFNMPPCRCFVCWDKIRDVDNFSMCEFAWTSFDMPAKLFKYCNNAGFILKQSDKKIHPTQKPIALYGYLISKFAKEGDKILDTHLGSGSSRIAAYQMGFDFYGCELDTEYFNEANKRFKIETLQKEMFSFSEQSEQLTTEELFKT